MTSQLDAAVSMCWRGSEPRGPAEGEGSVIDPRSAAGSEAWHIRDLKAARSAPVLCFNANGLQRMAAHLQRVRHCQRDASRPQCARIVHERGPP